MSGGSYNYLCYADSTEIQNRLQDLQSMADDLAALGYADDAAKETQNLLLTIRQFQNRIEASVDRLEDVWHAREWWTSGDYLESDFKKALEKYRGICNV